jgi:ectoine hydroxylase-related dioxygenase (phytanoyl-CoA dioxygenase family)
MFTIDQADAIKKYFHEHGYVVVQDALTPEECQNTYNEINAQLKQLDDRFDITDVNTYEHAKIVNNYGLYTNTPIFSRQFMLNRQNKNIHQIFSLLYDTKDFLVNQDRCAFYRPAKGLIINNTHCDKPEWKTPYTYPEVHLDFHPSTYEDSKFLLDKREQLKYDTPRDFVTENNLYCKEDGLQIQAVINLLDNREEDGGFQCVPGFVHNFDEWFNNYKNGPNKQKDIVGNYFFSSADKNDIRYTHSPVRIPAPAGAIILWNQKTAHGSKPNDSNVPRCMQFIKMFPKKLYSKDRYKRRQKMMLKILKENNFTELTDVGKIVFGLN